MALVSATRLGVVSAGIALLTMGAPLKARAGATTITAHKASIQVKAVTQDDNPSGNDVRHTENVSPNELFELCVGSRPEKNQAIYIFLDCSNLNNNTIAAVQTSAGTTSATLIKTIGDIDFLTPVVQTSTKGGTMITSQKMPAVVHLTCAPAVTADITGVANVTFKTLDSGSCPNVVKVQGTGSGAADIPGQFTGNFVVDQGTVVNGSARSASITGFPVGP